jgi:hypothetical protein
MILKLVASSVTMPKFIVPKVRRLTCTPERPKDLYCILLLLFVILVLNLVRPNKRRLSFLRVHLHACGPTPCKALIARRSAMAR